MSFERVTLHCNQIAVVSFQITVVTLKYGAGSSELITGCLDGYMKIIFKQTTCYS